MVYEESHQSRLQMPLPFYRRRNTAEIAGANGGWDGPAIPDCAGDVGESRDEADQLACEAV